MKVGSYIYTNSYAPADTNQLWVKPMSNGEAILYIFVDGKWTPTGGVGESAYEAAVKAGFNGSKQEWLDSLALKYSDLTAEQKADLVKDAVSAAERAAQAVENIENTINNIDISSTDGAITALAAKQGLLENELDALGPKIDKNEVDIDNLDAVVNGGETVVETKIAEDSFMSNVLAGSQQFSIVSGNKYKVHCQSAEPLNQTQLVLYFRSSASDSEVSDKYYAGNADISQGVDFELTASASGTALMRVSTSGVASPKTLSFEVYSVSETTHEGLVNEVEQLFNQSNKIRDAISVQKTGTNSINILPSEFGISSLPIGTKISVKCITDGTNWNFYGVSSGGSDTRLAYGKSEEQKIIILDTEYASLRLHVDGSTTFSLLVSIHSDFSIIKDIYVHDIYKSLSNIEANEQNINEEIQEVKSKTVGNNYSREVNSFYIDVSISEGECFTIISRTNKSFNLYGVMADGSTDSFGSVAANSNASFIAKHPYTKIFVYRSAVTQYNFTLIIGIIGNAYKIDDINTRLQNINEKIKSSIVVTKAGTNQAQINSSEFGISSFPIGTKISVLVNTTNTRYNFYGVTNDDTNVNIFNEDSGKTVIYTIQQEFKALKAYANGATSLTSTVTIHSDLTLLELRAQIIESALSNVQSSIKGLSNINGLTLACLGDSFTAGSNSYVGKIAAVTGCSVLNYGVSSSRIVRDSGNILSFNSRYSSMNSDADLVTIFGGINDAYDLGRGDLVLGDMSSPLDLTTFYGGMRLLLEGLLVKYQAKKIFGIIPPLCPKSYYLQQLPYVQAAEREIYAYYGVPIIDLDRDCFKMSVRIPSIMDMYRDPDSETDYIRHPNSNGHIALKDAILAGILRYL